MSIAIHTRHAGTPRAGTFTLPARPSAKKRGAVSPAAQLRDSRALLRHLMLAVMSVGVIIYAGIAAGLPV
jgi:hypothetical protein